jgi:hypothetical protein
VSFTSATGYASDQRPSDAVPHKGEKAPIQASGRWHVERANSWHNAFNRLQRCYERREVVIDAFFELAGATRLPI